MKIDTPLGPMIAIVDDNQLFLLEFTDRKGIELEIERLRKTGNIDFGNNYTLITIQKEIHAYFEGKLIAFETPPVFQGTIMQQKIWKTLQHVPYGETKTYSELAELAHYSQAVRAVASAIGSNQLAILIPCHRVINKNGNLGGYSGGLNRKKWLLEFERKQKQLDLL